MSLQEFEALNLQIIEAKKALKERDRILSIMASIDRELAFERDMLPRYKSKLLAEEFEVETLHDITLASLFYSLLGSRDARLEDATEDYLETKLKVEKSQIKIASLEQYFIELEEQLVDLANSDDELEKLQLAQLAYMAKQGSSEAKRLHEIAEVLSAEFVKQHEIEEALLIGPQVARDIDKVIDILIEGKRAGHGYWAITHSLAGKQDPIGDAIKLALATQPKLEKFHQEMRDVLDRPWAPPSVNVPSRDTGFFFKGFHTRSLSRTRLVNLEMQPRVENWLQHLQKLSQLITQNVVMLQTEQTKSTQLIEALNKEKEPLMRQLWNLS